MFLFNVVTGGKFVRLAGTYVGRKEARKYIKKKAGWLAVEKSAKICCT